MAAMQMCKPTQVTCDQTKNPKIVQNNEKKHHLFHFWHKQENENTNEQQIHKQQHEAGHPKHGNNVHKNGHGQAGNKQQHEVGHPKHGNNVHHRQAANNKPQHEAVSQPRSHKLRQCFGHGAPLGSDFEETETVVIERKIKERVVISHVKKCHDHKEGAKHLDRC